MELTAVRAVSAIAIGCLVVDLAALAAHVLELPNKLALDGPLWLAVQQRLYRGWGPVLGPFEVAAVVATWALAWMRRRAPTFGRTLGAAVLLTVSFAVFFLVVQPVNAALATWTAATLPADWAAHRLQWELGHAARMVLAAAGLALLIQVALRETRRGAARPPERRVVDRWTREPLPRHQ